jgi:hypothetical protein
MSNLPERDYFDSDLARELLDIAGQPSDYRARAYYDPDGDYIEYLSKPDSHDDERVDSLVTAYYSIDANELIGAKIKGVKALLRRHPLLCIAVKDGRVNLRLLIMGGLIATGRLAPDEARTAMIDCEKVDRSLLELMKEHGEGLKADELLSA